MLTLGWIARSIVISIVKLNLDSGLPKPCTLSWSKYFIKTSDLLSAVLNYDVGQEKQYCTQEEGQTNEGRHHLLLLHTQINGKRDMHANITRTRLTACEVGVFLREISQFSKIRLPPSLRSHLCSLLIHCYF